MYISYKKKFSLETFFFHYTCFRLCHTNEQYMLNICKKNSINQKCQDFVILFPSSHKEVLRRKKPKVQKIPDLFLPFQCVNTAGQHYLHCSETFLSGHISYLSATQSTFSNNQLYICYVTIFSHRIRKNSSRFSSDLVNFNRTAAVVIRL